MFGALALLFFARLFAGDASRMPSALIGQSAPPLDLAALDGAAGLKDADLRAGPCHGRQHFRVLVRSPATKSMRLLLDLAADKTLAAKGVQADRRRAEGRAGEHPPLSRRQGQSLRQASGSTADGRAGIDWGVYGVPETFIVKGDGTIAFKLVGPMTRRNAGERRAAGDREGDELTAPVGSSPRISSACA